MKKILTENLTLTSIPDPNGKVKEIDQFALTFDIEEVNNKIYELSLESDFEELPIIQLRYILYCEQRRWNHFGKDYDNCTENRIRQLITTLRNKIRQ